MVPFGLMRGSLFAIALLAACGRVQPSETAPDTELDASLADANDERPSTPESGATDAGVADAAISAQDAGIVDSGDERDGGATDPRACDDFLDGELVAYVPPISMGGASLSHAEGTFDGVYFSGGVTVCLSHVGCNAVNGLYFADAPTSEPKIVSSAAMASFAVVAGHAYFFDEAAVLTELELSSGATHATDIVGSDFSGHEITSDGAAIYWVVDAGEAHSLLRAAVEADGSLGAPVLVRGTAVPLGGVAASARGIGWFEGREAFVLPSGGGEPQAWFADDSPDIYWQMATNETTLFVLSNDHGPFLDGGSWEGGQSLIPGPFLGARITSRDIAGGPVSVLHDSTIELQQIAATPEAVLWIDSFDVPGDGACHRLWRQPLAGGAPRLVASGASVAPVGGITTYGETVYWWAGSSVYRFEP